MSSVLSQISSVSASRSACGVTWLQPALLTRTSRRPQRSSISATMRLTSFSSGHRGLDGDRVTARGDRILPTTSAACWAEAPVVHRHSSRLQQRTAPRWPGPSRFRRPSRAQLCFRVSWLRSPHCSGPGCAPPLALTLLKAVCDLATSSPNQTNRRTANPSARMSETRSIELRLESKIDSVDAAELIVQALARDAGFGPGRYRPPGNGGPGVDGQCGYARQRLQQRQVGNTSPCAWRRAS